MQVKNLDKNLYNFRFQKISIVWTLISNYKDCKLYKGKLIDIGSLFEV